MDDYSINSLTESKNEWCARLVSILSFNVIEGIKSIYAEAVKLCVENDEENKYLMTFQNLLSQIPQWNENTIENETKRIEVESKCKYLEDLITCVHIIQLKALSCIRVGQKQKKIDIDIPSINKFIHQTYVNSARKLYTNVYLFEKDLLPLQLQKNNRELEILIKEAILITIRDNIPVERILRAYMDETEEIEETDQQERELNRMIAEREAETDLSGNIKLSTESKINQSVQSSLNNLAIKTESAINPESDVKMESTINLESDVKTESAVPSMDALLSENNKDIQSTPTLEEKSQFSLNFSNTNNLIDANNNEKVITAESPTLTSQNKDENNDSILNIGDDYDNSKDNMDIISLE